LIQDQRAQKLKKPEKNEDKDPQKILLKNLALSRYPDYTQSFPLGNGKTIDIKICQISYIKSDGISCQFYFHNGAHKPIAIRMANCQKKMSAFGFLRVHRSYMVNCSCIKKLKWTREGEMELACGAMIPLSRRKKEEIEDYLHMIDFTHLL